MTEGSRGEADPQGDAEQPMARGALGAWWFQGLRTAALLRADWSGLQVTPSVVACLVLVPYMAGLGIDRLTIDGAATFYWPSLLTGWLDTAVAIWACWLLVRRDGDATRAGEPPSAAALFAMLSAQALTLTLVCGLLFVPLARDPGFVATPHGRWASWAAWTLAIAWTAAAQVALVWRSGMLRIQPRAIAAALLLGSLALNQWLQPSRHWYPSEPRGADAGAPEPLRFTQELLELQPQILQTKLQAIGAERPGVVDLYAITFAPYASEDVFQRESDLVATVMQERFGAAGKSLQLVNHTRTVREWPWATPLNLQRAIRRVAQVMNRDEDVLFIHLTSHGARDGQLSAAFWPLDVDPLTPQMLRGWLDEAGIRYRVISVSACYSGSWIEPLAAPATLVMTAADADHTSYGCGRGSVLTYFGRAMFDEQLRRTRSFETAHAQARTVIDQREREAGKSDGYSNPQIRIGEAIREPLARIEAQSGKTGE
jgi:Peptidase C13 family